MGRVIECLKDHGGLEVNPKMEGRILAALFAPVGQLSKAQIAASQAVAVASQKAVANPNTQGPRNTGFSPYSRRK
jgi:hypothetical protein